jgi:gliding motility-associated lipoprotein GldH
VLCLILCLGACTPKHSSYSEFKDIEPEGWQKTIAYEFVPQYSDSSVKYDVEVALCFSHGYGYRNMSVIVDFVKGDSLVNRKMADFVLTDENGNWQTAGFGVMYQAKQTVLKNIEPAYFDKIQIWHGLNCDTLKNVIKVGAVVKQEDK